MNLIIWTCCFGLSFAMYGDFEARKEEFWCESLFGSDVTVKS